MCACDQIDRVIRRLLFDELCCVSDRLSEFKSVSAWLRVRMILHEGVRECAGVRVRVKERVRERERK